MSKEKIIQTFITRVGEEPDLENPKGFNEKCLVRKLFDRRPILAQMSDKMESRELINNRTTPVDTIPIIYATDFKNGFPKLPKITQFPIMVKPTNASGRNRILTTQHDFERYVKKIYQAREVDYGIEKGEWAYSQVPAGVIVEPVIENYFEFKFFCFHGRCELIWALQPRKEFVPKKKDPPEAHGVSLFWPDGRRVDVKSKKWPVGYGSLPGFVKPVLPYVHELSLDMDFVRLDLFYQIEEQRWYFTEYTLYPGAGHTLWQPLEFDKQLGEFWKEVECG